jgi:glycosyltransferase involved in cell wall biosynthesis
MKDRRKLMCCKTPKVSIALPVYNGEKYVREAIESVLAQTFKDFELIICDNASTDQTERICREYANKDRRIRYYRNEKNLGCAKNFNCAFELSSGEFFKWLAADNAIEPQFIAKCFDLLDNDPTVVLACTKYIQRDEFTNTLRTIDVDYNLSSSIAHQRFREVIDKVVGLNGNLPIWGLMRSSILNQTHLIRPFIGSDDCLLIELALIGKFAQVPERLKRLRHHPGAFHTLRYQNDGREGAAEAQYIDTESKNSFYLPYWRRLWEYFLLAVHSKEGFGSKCIMVAFLVYPVGTKWLKRLIKELFFAVGLGRLYNCMKETKRHICGLFKRTKCVEK